MPSLAVMRARRRASELERAARTLPQEVKDQVWREIDTHAPELRALIEQTNAVPLYFRVRTVGGGWRKVISPAIIKQHTQEET